MNRCLRLLSYLPLLATTACAADAIAGSELAPATVRVADPGAGPQLPREAKAQADPAACQGCIVPPARPGNGTMYVVDGVIVSSRPELDAADLVSVEVSERPGSCHNAVTQMVFIATRSGSGASQ